MLCRCTKANFTLPSIECVHTTYEYIDMSKHAFCWRT